MSGFPDWAQRPEKEEHSIRKAVMLCDSLEALLDSKVQNKKKRLKGVLSEIRRELGGS